MNATYTFSDGMTMNLSWKRRWEQLAIAVDGRQIVDSTRSQLLEGIKVVLPDSSSVEVRLEPSEGLHWRRNATDFPGPGTPALGRVRAAQAALIIYGIGNLAFGPVGYFLLGAGLTASLLSCAAGLLFLVSAAVKKGRSKVAIGVSSLVIAAALVNNLVSIIRVFSQGGYMGIAGLAVGIGFLVTILGALPAIQKLEAMDATGPE